MGYRHAPTDIVSVNLECGLVINANGESGLITNYFNDIGEECGHENAILCVAECSGAWHVVDLRQFEPVFSN